MGHITSTRCDKGTDGSCPGIPHTQGTRRCWAGSIVYWRDVGNPRMCVICIVHALDMRMAQVNPACCSFVPVLDSSMKLHMHMRLVYASSRELLPLVSVNALDVGIPCEMTHVDRGSTHRDGHTLSTTNITYRPSSPTLHPTPSVKSIFQIDDSTNGLSTALSDMPWNIVRYLT